MLRLRSYRQSLPPQIRLKKWRSQLLRPRRSKPEAAQNEANRKLSDYQTEVREKFSNAKTKSEREAEGLRAQLREQELSAKMELSKAGRRGGAESAMRHVPS